MSPTTQSHPPHPATDGTLILGIETSCDETAASIVEWSDGAPRVLSNVVSTQHEIHARYAGVVPELASRAHLERIVPVVREALRSADLAGRPVSAVAIGNRPGLIGSLLVGNAAAKAYAWSLGIPVIGIDHIAAHLVAGLLDAPPVGWPALGLVASGGHTHLFRMKPCSTPCAVFPPLPIDPRPARHCRSPSSACPTWRPAFSQPRSIKSWTYSIALWNASKRRTIAP